MDLTLAEIYFIISHHPTVNKLILDYSHYEIGMIGSFLLDLESKDCLSIIDSSLLVEKSGSNMTKAHDQILSIINDSQKRRPIKKWIKKIKSDYNSLDSHLQEELIAKEIVQVNQKKKWFGTVKIISICDLKLRNEIIEDLRKYIEETKNNNAKFNSIVRLIFASQMFSLFTNDRKEIKMYKNMIKEHISIMDKNEIDQGLNRMIKNEILKSAAIDGGFAAIDF